MAPPLKETLVVDWDQAMLSTELEPQAATAFVANHENSKPADLADAIHEMNDKRMVEIAAELQDERLADVLQELPEEDQVQILSYLADERAAQVLEEMEPDDAADLLIELDDVQREKLLELMEPDEADDVRRLLEYDEGTAGSLMNPVPIILSPKPQLPRRWRIFAPKKSRPRWLPRFWWPGRPSKRRPANIWGWCICSSFCGCHQANRLATF